MARQVLENGVILPAEYSDDWYDDMTSNLTKLDDVIGSDSEKLSSSDVGAAALSNNYNDLDNLPTIPTVNDATLTIQKNGVDVETFTANASSNVTANITVPTKTSDLTNDSDFVDTSNSAVSSGITSAKVTDYDTHIADTDIHVTTADKSSWNTVTSKANDSDVVHKSGNETISGIKSFPDGIVANVTGSATSAINDGSGNVISSTYGKLGVTNEWTGANTFKQNITYERTNFYHQSVSPCYYLKDTELKKGSLASTHTAYPGLWQDKDNNILGYVRFVEYSSGRQTAEFRVSNLIKNGALDPTGSEVNCTVDLELQPSGEKSLIPEQNNDINLGTSTNKWKTLNGVEPSSLSLPSGNVNDVIDISSYLVNLDGTDNTYVAPANGWITINMNNCSGIHATITGLWSDSRVRASAGAVKFLMPVLKNQTVTLTIHGGTINNARFIPCQGNV